MSFQYILCEHPNYILVDSSFSEILEIKKGEYEGEYVEHFLLCAKALLIYKRRKEPLALRLAELLHWRYDEWSVPKDRINANVKKINFHAPGLISPCIETCAFRIMQQKATRFFNSL